MTRPHLTRPTRREGPGGSRTGGRPPTGRIAVSVAAAAAVAAGAGWASRSGPFAASARPGASPGTIPTSTATVIRTSITASEEDAGTLGYDASFTIYAGRAGTVTWLPVPGTVIRPGQQLLAVDGQGTVLFTGQSPAWRGFAPGMTDGPDVRELERNLVAGGYDPQRAIVIDDHYDWATQVAVERWQAAQGAGVAGLDGQIPLGQIAFLPAPLRIAALSATPGATVAPGAPVFTATSARPVVDVALPASQEPLVHRGQGVTVTMPGGGSTPGRVLRIDLGVPPGPGPGGPGSSPGSQSPAAATVTAVISLVHPSVAAGLDQAPVQVAIATQTQRDVLAAPISALLPKPGGGFQVTVVRGRSQRNVTVRTGLFDDLSGTVAISGPGITAGTTVQVPSP